jgi:hypothetical protein
MALTAVRCGAQNSVAIGAATDITGLEAAGGSIENDPTGQPAANFAVMHNAALRTALW